MTESGLFGWKAPVCGQTDVEIEVVGVPSDLGHSFLSGTRHGPKAIRQASSAIRTSVHGIDHGDIGQACEQDWHDVLNDVQAMVTNIFSRGSRLLLLGGDHAVSYAAVAGAACFRPLNIVWFDAHTDFCNLTSDDWHNHKQVLRRIAALPHVGRIVQIGHRGITYFDEVERFERIDIIGSAIATRSLQTALGTLPVNEPIYMSIDIDAVDPRWAPGTGHPVPGGLSVAGLRELAGAISSARAVIGVDLMEVNPMLDRDEMTSTAAVSILAGIVPNLERRYANDRSPASS